jgi:hypothetical protein
MNEAGAYDEQQLTTKQNLTATKGAMCGWWISFFNEHILIMDGMMGGITHTKRDSSSFLSLSNRAVLPMSECVLGFEPNQHRLSTTSHI